MFLRSLWGPWWCTVKMKKDGNLFRNVCAGAGRRGCMRESVRVSARLWLGSYVRVRDPTDSRERLAMTSLGQRRLIRVIAPISIMPAFLPHHHPGLAPDHGRWSTRHDRRSMDIIKGTKVTIPSVICRADVFCRVAGRTAEHPEYGYICTRNAFKLLYNQASSLPSSPHSKL